MSGGGIKWEQYRAWFSCCFFYLFLLPNFAEKCPQILSYFEPFQKLKKGKKSSMKTTPYTTDGTNLTS